MEPGPPGDAAPGTQDQADLWASGQECQASADPSAQYPVGAYPPGYEYNPYADPYAAYYYGAYSAAAGMYRDLICMLSHQ